jgi:hypothetical protein
MQEKSYEHWSQGWEDTVGDLLAHQSAVQAEIDECLSEGDLLGAATASFDHALSSWRLGDYKEAHSYIVVGQMFGCADIAFRKEVAQDDPQLITFEVPQLINLGSMFGREETNIRQAVEGPLREAVTEAEAVLSLDAEFIDSTEKNGVLTKAIREACEIIFSERVNGYPISNEDRVKLLGLAKGLALHLDVNADEESTMLALDSFTNLAHAAILLEGGQVLSAMNTAYRGFEEIQYGPAADKATEKCMQNMKLINRAKANWFGYAVVYPIVALLQLHQNTASTSQGYTLPRASTSLREEVKLRHELSKGTKKLPENSQQIPA